ncbi:hypothetical protein HHK36_027163 [Tetracentron sinense]|uniref:GH16 domain-containing protein n=1 Tax=Tetracentron sinense TaxID=13715 RepID=A0A834YMQ0_TETSI|nr:hypothetical protein HHK36_027163 [Tetracentron sinense]
MPQAPLALDGTQDGLNSCDAVIGGTGYSTIECLAKSMNDVDQLVAPSDHLFALASIESGAVEHEGSVVVPCGVNVDNYSQLRDLNLQTPKSLGALREGETIHGYVQEERLDTNVQVYNVVIDMYAKCSSLMAASAGNFNQDFDITWDDGRTKMINNGQLLRLSLDKVSCSGFQSKREYLFGRIDIQLKLVPRKLGQHRHSLLRKFHSIEA